MQVIKCPNCGSGEVKQLTEEKYYCLSCDNTFMVHDSSKEFRKTDEHISEVHKDLKETISSLSETISEGDSENQKVILIEAMQDLRKGNYLDAYDSFEKYSKYKADSYEGYYGMFCALTENLECEYTSSSDVRICDGFDVLVKALDCEDCDKEKVLSSVKDYYLKAKIRLAEKNLYLYEGQSVSEEIEELEELNNEETETIEKYNNSTLLDRVKKNAVKLVATAVAVVICLLIGNKVYGISSGFIGLLFKIVGLAIYAFTVIGGLFILYMILGRPSDNREFRNEKIERLKELEKLQLMDIAEMESIIRSEEHTGNSAEEMYDILAEIEAEEEEEYQRESEPLRTLVLTRRGNKKALINLLMEIGNTKKFAVYAANANEPVEILYGCNHSKAVEYQRRFLAETNSVVNIV